MLQDKVSAPQVPQGRLKLLQMSLAHLLPSRLAPANSAKMRQVTMDTTRRRIFRTSYQPLMLWLCCPSFFQSCFWASCPLLRASGLCDRPDLKVYLATAERAERASQRPTSRNCLCCSSTATAGKQRCALEPLSDIRRSPSHVGKLN